MGHSYDGIFQFYINQRVKCDVQAAYLDEPSDRALVKVMGNMSLTFDPLAPKEPTKEQLCEIANHPKIVKLRQQRDALTEKIRQIRNSSEPFTLSNEEDLIQQKKEVNATLNRKMKRLRDKAERMAREAYFMNNDTMELEKECKGVSPDDSSAADQAATVTYQLEERARIAELLCSPHGDLAEPVNLNRRIDLIRNFTKLCSRREARRRNTPPDSSKGMAMKQEDLATPHSFPLKCDPRQCLFCMGDERLPYQQRIFCWSRPAKMMDHVEDKHLHLFALDAKIPCSHPVCKESHMILNGVLHFKSHAQTVHKIKHRVLKTNSM